MRGYRAAHAFDGERPRPDGALVLVEGGSIVGVESASYPAPTGCPVTNLPGATLLPGLIDAHTHLCGDGGPRALDQLAELDDAAVDAVVADSMRIDLRAGVTAVRDLGDARWAVLDRHRGAPDGPTVVASGPPITSPDGHCWWLGGVAAGIDGLRRAVRERVDHRADVVKIMTSGGAMSPGSDVLACQFTLPELRAVVEEAHEAGLPVTAHAHAVPAVERSVAAGVDGIEHCTCITLDGIRMPPELAERIAAAGITVCPTLGMARDAALSPQVLAVMARTGLTIEGRRAQVGQLYRAGVTLIAGLDSGINPGKRHGVLPETIIEFVASGLSPSAALTAGTSGAARACGLGGRTGRLATGLDADVVAVHGDPLTDITALRDVRLVLSRGREVALATA